MATLKKTNIKDQIRAQAEADLISFIRLIHPQRVLGHIHEELIRWWTREDAKDHQLTLLPRDHGKSAMIAYRVAWEITKNPAIRVLYISSTANLAEKQLGFIKDILTSSIYRDYWPDMVNEEEGKRAKWTTSEISVDHPLRRDEAIRDPTIFTAGLTTGITGMHCDIAVLDDVVVKENAYTEEGRAKVRSQYSLLASIESSEAEEWIVGTRYHPKDLYNDLLQMSVSTYDENDEEIGVEALYEVFERQVEDRGDGSGNFLWPVQTRYDGKKFGFDARILAKKKEKYLDKTQFRAQYYNDPNDSETSTIKKEYFQYYNKGRMTRNEGKWYYDGKKLNVFAAVDFAFSLKKKADYTAIVVIGVDSSSNYFILDIERFRTDQISGYYEKIFQLHNKWGFRKIRAEVTVAQQIIVSDLKNNYIQPNGLALAVDEYRPSKAEGTKEERIEACLQPRYANRQIWHFQGGHCQTLEEELLLSNPPHDDVKDALTSAIECAVIPSFTERAYNPLRSQQLYHPRFGGIS